MNSHSGSTEAVDARNCAELLAQLNEHVEGAIFALASNRLSQFLAHLSAQEQLCRVLEIALRTPSCPAEPVITGEVQENLMKLTMSLRVCATLLRRSQRTSELMERLHRSRLSYLPGVTQPSMDSRVSCEA